MRDDVVGIARSRRVRVVSATLFLVVAASIARAGAPVLDLKVDCNAGDSVAAALDKAEQHFGPVSVMVKGVCPERIVIRRDDVTVYGAGAGDGLDGTGLGGSAPLVEVLGAQRVLLTQLTLTPQGLDGIVLRGGAALVAVSLDIDGAGSGLSLQQHTSLRFESSTVTHSSQSGLTARGAHVVFDHSIASRNGSTGISIAGGHLELYGSEVDDNAYWGVSIIDNGHGLVSGTSITGNLVGLFLRNNASAGVGGESRISENGSQGIRVWDGSSLILGVKAYVDSNQADGVHVVGNSTVTPVSSTKIAYNGGSGFNVRDTSLLHVTAGNNPDIVGNNGWGIFCEGWPADARLSPPGYTTANVFGNSSGQINCPGYFIP